MSNPTTEERINALTTQIARATGYSADDIRRALQSFAEAIQAQADAIRDGFRAYEATKTTLTEHRHGRSAQTSPYDIGARR